MRRFLASSAGRVSTVVSVIAATVAVLALVAFPGLSFGETTGHGQADHMILNQVSGVGSNVGYCGVASQKEPWSLDVAASGGAGTLTIQFRDGDAVSFDILAGGSTSLTESFGGVPGTDDLVRISLGGASSAGIVSALARPSAIDPFIEPGAPESDNLCVNLNDEGPINTTQNVPNSWVVDADGSNGGVLQ